MSEKRKDSLSVLKYNLIRRCLQSQKAESQEDGIQAGRSGNAAILQKAISEYWKGGKKKANKVKGWF